MGMDDCLDILPFVIDREMERDLRGGKKLSANSTTF
jgi:hypothetical protein